MKIQFLSNNIDIITIDTFSTDYNENVLRDNPQMHDTMGHFPTANFCFNVIEPYINLRKIQKGDYVILTINQERGFAGSVSSAKFERNGNSNYKLTVKAIHSFHKLLFFSLNRKFPSTRNSLRKLLQELKTFCQIEGNIKVDVDVDDNININLTNKYPAFLLLRHLALQKNLVFRFECSGSMWVCNKDTFRRWSYESTPIKVVTPDDPRFINFTFETS